MAFVIKNNEQSSSDSITSYAGTTTSKAKHIFANGSSGSNPNRPLLQHVGDKSKAHISAIRHCLIDWCGPDYTFDNNRALKKMAKLDLFTKVVEEFTNTIVQILLRSTLDEQYEKLQKYADQLNKTINARLYKRAAVTSIIAHLSDYFGTMDFFKEHESYITQFMQKYSFIDPSDLADLSYDEIVKHNLMSQRDHVISVKENVQLLSKKMKTQVYRSMEKSVYVLQFLYSYFAAGTIHTTFNFGALVNTLKLVTDNNNIYDQYVDEYYEMAENGFHEDYTMFKKQKVMQCPVLNVPEILAYGYGESEKSPFKFTGLVHPSFNVTQTLVGNPDDKMSFCVPQVSFKPKLMSSFRTLRQQLVDFVNRNMATFVTPIVPHFSLVPSHFDFDPIALKRVTIYDGYIARHYYYTSIRNLHITNCISTTLFMIYRGHYKRWHAPFMILLIDDKIVIYDEDAHQSYRFNDIIIDNVDFFCMVTAQMEKVPVYGTSTASTDPARRNWPMVVQNITDCTIALHCTRNQVNMGFQKLIAKTYTMLYQMRSYMMCGDVIDRFLHIMRPPSVDF